MSVARLGCAFVALILLSGCASGGKKLSRLQSQVGLLDERVTQLERTSLGQTASWSDSSMDVGSGFESSLPSAPRAAKKAPAGTTAKSGKYATRDIQQALKNAGFYEGAVDGKVGPQTRAATKEFQRVHGLKDDGVVGRQTWAKLSGYTDLSGSGAAPAQTADAGTEVTTEFLK